MRRSSVCSTRDLVWLVALLARLDAFSPAATGGFSGSVPPVFWNNHPTYDYEVT